VSKRRTKSKNPPGRPRSYGPASRIPDPVPSQPSLPPAADATPTLPAPPPSTALAVRKPGQRGTLAGTQRGPYKKRMDTRKRRIAMQAVAMRINGLSDEAIAEAFKVTKRTVQGYIYEAGREGLLDPHLHDPKDRVEYKIVNKALDQIEEALDSTAVSLTTGVPLRTTVALKVAEGTIFKQFEPQQAQQGPQQVVAIKIEMPAGAPQVVREGTIGGTPAYVEGETT
jgi:hypothetical protein